jgi:hypothetical protein
MCEAGVNIKAMQDILGHADAETTMNIYADATSDLKELEMKNFGQFFSSMKRKREAVPDDETYDQAYDRMVEYTTTYDRRLVSCEEIKSEEGQMSRSIFIHLPFLNSGYNECWYHPTASNHQTVPIICSDFCLCCSPQS